MRKDFFTLGGSQFWEDVFYYQKWRIQRNYKTKQCRLLDNWDIRRAEGSFETCRRAFIKYIEVFQLSRQKGHMVIMLHGFGESKNIFKPLWRLLVQKGYLVAALNYPSTQKRIDAHVRQIDFFLNHLEDIHTISFVTNGIGCFVLRQLMAKDSPWKSALKVKRIVEICPTDPESRLFSFFAQYKFCNRLCGEILQDLSPEVMLQYPYYNNKEQVGEINCRFWYSDFCKWLGFNILAKNPQNARKKELDSRISRITVKNIIRSPFGNATVLKKCLKFLDTGKF